MQNFKNIIEQAYNIIDDSTPIDIDCGSLCSRACCQGDDRTGMILYPGEEQFFPEETPSWYRLQDTDIFLSNGHNLKLLTCTGTCPREMRPLACRIFPLIPYITEESILEIRLDPKSLQFCPLSSDPEKYPIDEHFIDALYDAFEVLIASDEIVEFIELLSDDYDTMKKFWQQEE